MLCSPCIRFWPLRNRAAPAGDAPFAAPLHPWAALLLASARTARPTGSLCRPRLAPRAFGPCVPLGAAQDCFIATLKNNSGPRRFYLRIREERQIVAPRRSPPGTPPRNPAQLAWASGGGCGARLRSRLRAGALRARPRCPRRPLLRSPQGARSVEAARRSSRRCLRRIRGTGAQGPWK